MTSQLEIGYMIIQSAKTDAVLQSRYVDCDTPVWYNVGSEEPINTSNHEYRLKEVPKIKYYRAYEDSMNRSHLCESARPWGLWQPTKGETHLHDFQIEEDE